jgi:hypothetical protein
MDNGWMDQLIILLFKLTLHWYSCQCHQYRYFANGGSAATSIEHFIAYFSWLLLAYVKYHSTEFVETSSDFVEAKLDHISSHITTYLASSLFSLSLLEVSLTFVHFVPQAFLSSTEFWVGWSIRIWRARALASSAFTSFSHSGQYAEIPFPFLSAVVLFYDHTLLTRVIIACAAPAVMHCHCHCFGIDAVYQEPTRAGLW